MIEMTTKAEKKFLITFWSIILLIAFLISIIVHKLTAPSMPFGIMVMVAFIGISVLCVFWPQRWWPRKWRKYWKSQKSDVHIPPGDSFSFGDGDGDGGDGGDGDGGDGGDGGNGGP